MIVITPEEFQAKICQVDICKVWPPDRENVWVCPSQKSVEEEAAKYAHLIRQVDSDLV